MVITALSEIVDYDHFQIEGDWSVEEPFILCQHFQQEVKIGRNKSIMIEGKKNKRDIATAFDLQIFLMD